MIESRSNPEHREPRNSKGSPIAMQPPHPNRRFHNGVSLTLRCIVVHRKLSHSRFSLLSVFIITNKNEIPINIFMTFSLYSPILKLMCDQFSLISVGVFFMKREFGSFEVLGDIHYFIPGKIPPTNPPLVLSNRIMELYGSAMHGLGKLNELSKRLRSPERFVKAYIIKEALMSSSIEGIHTTLLEVYTHPIDNTKPNKATQLVFNYTESLKGALSLMKELPISSRVIRSAHEVLMSNGTGDKFNPGEYRQQSVKVGDFYPTLPKHVPQLMADLEQYINMDTTHPPLIKSAIAHLQFETIHPFLDGNGRIGRLLILLMLIDNRLLSSPILYPSFHFKKRQAEYYLRLSNGNIKGEFEEWIEFYLEVLEASCNDAYRRALEIEQLEVDIMKLFQSNPKHRRYLNVAEAALPFLFDQPVFSITQLAEYLNRTYNATQNFLSILIASELVLSDPVKKQNRLFRFQPYLEILEREYGIH